LNSTRKWIRVKDLPIELIAQISRVLHLYSTALIKITSTPLEGEKASLIGSGTLISVDDVYGILTAQHVVDLIDKSCKLGMILIEGVHRFDVEEEHLLIIEIAKPKAQEYGPDLAFICLPISKVAEMKAYKSFLDLSVDREELLSATPDLHDGVWFLCGVPDEWTMPDQSEKGFEKISSFSGLCGAGGVTDEYDIEGYDYIDALIEYVDETTLPKSFGGISGGGLWQVILKESSDKKLEPDRYLFYGVPFYQSSIVERKRQIRCHSRNSVYQTAYSLIKKQCS